MNGFREFATKKPDPNPHYIALLDQAKVMLEESWEGEFHQSILQRVMDGWALSPKQVLLLEKIASGEIAEKRLESGRYHDDFPMGD